jgi:hypothetical protein
MAVDRHFRFHLAFGHVCDVDQAHARESYLVVALRIASAHHTCVLKGFCDGKGALHTSPMASNQSSVLEASLGKELPAPSAATDLSSIMTSDQDAGAGRGRPHF